MQDIVTDTYKINMIFWLLIDNDTIFNKKKLNIIYISSFFHYNNNATFER